MRAAYARSTDPDDPFAGLVVGQVDPPAVPEGWTTVEVRAASLNHHDLWTLRGVGISADRLPMILGCDAAGIDQQTGAEVIVYPVISSPDWSGDATMDPRRTLLSEVHPGTLAELVAVPRANLVAKPASISFADAACLPTAWLTAYRMLFVRANLRPGQTVLVQGATGGVGSACVALARAGGLRVWATARTEAKRAAATGFGAHAVFASGDRLPEPVDAVLDTVGAATWTHSLRSLRPGGELIICGATSGFSPANAELNRIFFKQLSVIGSTMGTRAEFADLLALCDATGLRPPVDRVIGLDDAESGLRALAAGDLLGKIVVTP